METLASIRDAILNADLLRIGSLLNQTPLSDIQIYREYAAKHLKYTQPFFPSERQVFQVGGVKFPMRWIPAGRFWMGAGADNEEAYGDEKPQHEVTITRGFWMGETPVTQGQYQVIMGENPAYFKEAGLGAPVEQVSWFDAAAFANKLSALEGASACFVGEGEKLDGVGNKGSDYLGCKGWGLPTEAEWEYACRAGTTTPRYKHLKQIAWYAENSGGTTHPVGEKEANAWGLHDMLGNVEEWTMDVYGPYAGLSTQDPLRSSGATVRVVRGGSWFSDAWIVRSANRDVNAPTDRNGALGFRLVKTHHE